jgi:hypothetical protein
MMFYGIDCEIKSLRRMSQNAKQEHSLLVSKQALDERFSSSSELFAKELLKRAIHSQVSTTINQTELQLFKTVRIKDSTTFEIHESLSSVFDGFGKGGGPNSKAGVSIQYEFDVKTNRVFDIDIKGATQIDSKDALAKIDDIQKDDLIIRELGYYSDQIIEQYIEREAFFISKLYHNVSVRLHANDDHKVDFKSLYNQMMEMEQNHLDMNVFIGKKKRPVRLIMVRVSDDVYEKRIRRRNKENKSLGYTMSDEYKSRARFNFYICNVSETQCSWETIANLYRVRWQIELVFKVWKSILHLDKIYKMKGQRLKTILYLKLLWILMNWQIISDCRNLFYKDKQRLLSISKCFQTLNELNSVLRKSLLQKSHEMQNIIRQIVSLLSENHWAEKRKNRTNFQDIIDLLFCNSNI